MFSLPGSAEPTMTKKKLWVDNIVCRLAIDLQTPADMFHFLCSRCVSYFTRVLRYHQGNMGGWLMVSISKHSLLYMCHWPKDPNVFNCLLLFFPPTPLSNSSLFSSFLPHHPLTFHLPPPSPGASPSFLFSAALLSPTSSSILLIVVFRSHNFAVKRAMRPPRSLHFLRGGDRRTGWKYRALGCKWRAIQIKNGPLILQMLYVLRDNIIKCSFSLLPVVK